MPETPPSHDTKPSQAPAPQQPVLQSQQLLQGHKTVLIEHNGASYRLQATRQGKLILTK